MRTDFSPRADAAPGCDTPKAAPEAPRLGFARAVSVAGLRALSVVAGLAYVKYYTNQLSVQEVGAFFYLGTLSYILNALVFVPVDSYMQARLSGIDALPWQSIRRLVAATLLVALCVCVALSLPFIGMGLLSVRDVPLLYGLAAMLYLCTSVRNLLNIRGQATFASSMIVLESVSRLLAFMLAVSVVGATAHTLLLSSIAALAMELVLLLRQARSTLPLSPQEVVLDHPKQIWKTTSALSGGAASNTVQLQAYRVLFPAAGHAGTAAMLGVTANIGAVAMSACAQVFSQLFLPRLYQTRGASIGQYVAWGTAMAAALLAVALPMSGFLVRHLTHAEYAAYAPAVGIGVVLEASNMLIGAFSVYLTLHGRAGALFRFQLAGAAVSLAGCLALVVHAPDSPMLIGLVIAGSQVLVTPALAFYVHRLQRQHA
jgi:O-antigen/teichoic acid export membrane protein